MGASSWEPEKFEVVLEAKQDLTELAAVRFVEAGGKVIESEPGGSMRSGFLGSVTEERTYRLAKKVDSVTIEIDYWLDKKTEKIKVELETGVGL